MKDEHSATNSQNAVKSKRKIWAEHMENIERIRIHTEIWQQSLKRGDHLAHTAEDDSIT